MDFIALNVALMTISDTRTDETDKSGALLAECVERAQHNVIARQIVPDNVYQIRAVLSQWIVNKQIDIIITTGGTGVTGRDSTPEAVMPLLDKTLDGFGEIFRMLSYAEIKTSTMQSRALAGVANGTYVFCLPGSANACRMAWNHLISLQLDSRTLPCNLVQLMPRLMEK